MINICLRVLWSRRFPDNILLYLCCEYATISAVPIFKIDCKYVFWFNDVLGDFHKFFPADDRSKRKGLPTAPPPTPHSVCPSLWCAFCQTMVAVATDGHRRHQYLSTGGRSTLDDAARTDPVSRGPRCRWPAYAARRVSRRGRLFRSGYPARHGTTDRSVYARNDTPTVG